MLRQEIENIALARTVGEFCPSIDTSAYIQERSDIISGTYGLDVGPDHPEVVISYVKFRSNFEKLPNRKNTCEAYAELF